MKKAVLTIFSLFLLCSYSAAAEPIVKIIEVRGLERIDEVSVRNRISQSVGSPLVSSGLSDDIKKIFGMGYFDDVRVEMEFYEGGIKLIYIVEEKPIISRVIFFGNKKFEEEALSEHVTLSRGAIADETLIRDNAENLKAFYESEGYWLAEVVPVIRNIRGTNAEITYMIRENKKVKIKNIDIIGNEAFSDEVLKSKIKTSEWGFLSFLSSNGYYKRFQFQQDIEKIRDHYLNNGYIGIRVSEPEVEVVVKPDRGAGCPDNDMFCGVIPDKNRVKTRFGEDKVIHVSLSVSEGRQFRVANVGIKGNDNFGEKDIRENVELEAGQVFSKKDLSADVESLNEFYTDRGYALVSIDPSVVPAKEGDVVDVTYNILEGSIYRVGRIEISGNTKTRDKVIRREMRLDEGDMFSGSKLKRSYQRLNNLDFFESVDLRPRPRRDEKLLDIDVNVKDKSTGMFSVGGGYSSLESFMMMIDITQANLFGTGRYIKANGTFGGRTVKYELSYRDPWFLDRPVSMRVSLYDTETDYNEYTRKALGFGLGFSKAFTEYVNAGLSYSLEEVTVTDIDATASTTIKSQEGTSLTSSITPTLVRDSRDFILDPHEGSRNAIFIKYAGLGGDNNYIKGVVDSSWFFPLGPTTIGIRGRYGYADGLSGKELPLYERFLLGGINTIRGLAWGAGGPVDINGDYIGGEQQILFNVEYLFPLTSEQRVKGLLFYDTGKAYNHDEPIGSLRQTAGAGIRWLSPLGPLRLEWGYVIDRKPGEDDSKVEFTFGTFF
ncbi:MAG: outer membrane protein assembly factor BamA [Nitrospirota bacterium]|nr:MAG: outer membrane protein assembly factor BamA [Nitrospirota bacterium]